MISALAHAALALAPLALASVANAADSTVLAAVLFQRHGDRTPKVFGDTDLTILGTSG